ncbi:hypothetical protein [Paenibacillus humicus]|uniref:hypothetical protein n=1 Tax=Paenibacillus humicus TaxID=412861 RepID=UPI0013E2E360|nr:hypothetical protein [Paenibacillus humicus]
MNTVILADSPRPCIECGTATRFVDILSEQSVCGDVCRTALHAWIDAKTERMMEGDTLE